MKQTLEEIIRNTEEWLSEAQQTHSNSFLENNKDTYSIDYFKKAVMFDKKFHKLTYQELLEVYCRNVNNGTYYYDKNKSMYVLACWYLINEKKNGER